MGYPQRAAEEAVEINSGFPLGGSCRPQAADEGQVCQYRPFTGRRGNAAPSSVCGQDRSHHPPRGKAFLPKNSHHPYKTVTTRAPCTYCGYTACAGGFCMLERASLFLLGGGAYAALELAWRGTTHWTMFLTGGGCRGGGRQRAGAGRRRSLPPRAAHRRLGLCRRVGQSGRAGLPQIHRLLVFAVRVGHFCAARC